MKIKNNEYFQVKGLKCDNPNCNYKDMSIQAEEYKNYINHPCPNCGCSLLTKADYKAVKRLYLLSLIFKFLKVNPNTGNQYSVNLNGKGQMKIKKD